MYYPVLIIGGGPAGAAAGIAFSGTPEQIAQCERSYTGQFLKRALKGKES